MALLGPDGRPLQRPQQIRRSGRNYLEGVHQWAGNLVRQDSLGIDTYQRMVDTDETVGAGLDFLAISACAKLGQYTHPKRRYQRFIQDCFEGMRGSLAMAVRDMLSALWAGFSVTEVCLRPEGGRWMLDQLATLNPTSVTFGLDLQPKSRTYGEVEHIWQWRYSAWEAHLDPRQVVHYVHQQRFGNPYGQSRLKRAYAPWFLKTNLLPAWGQAMERYAAPLTVGKTTNIGQEMEDDEGVITTRGQYMVDRLKELISGACVAIEEGEEISFQGLTTPVGENHEAAQNHLNKMILRSLLLPSLVFDNTDTGSYSLGEKHYDVYIMGLDYLLLEVTEALLEQLVRPLLWWNFGWDGELGEFARPPLQPEDQQKLIQGFVELTNAGYMSPENKPDLDYVREKVGLEIVESLPYSSPALPARPAAPSEEPDGDDEDGDGSPGPEPEHPAEMRMRLLRGVEATV